MGKEAEILELLEKGLTPVEIIGEGYAKSTVYKVNEKFSGKKKLRGLINLKYSIIGLKQESGMVLLTLREYRPPPPPEEIERARLEAELEQEEDITETDEQLQKVDFAPPPKTFEEKIFSAMKTQMPEMFESLKSMGNFQPPPRPPIYQASSISMIISPLEIWITNDQYRQLGSPSLFQIIKINLRMD